MKITDLIEGYDEMSAEEKLKALEELDAPEDNSDSVEEKYKKLISKANAEAKRYKDERNKAIEELNSKLSEQEIAQRREEEELENLKAQYEEAIKENSISKKFNHYKALGYSDELAKSTAEAFVNGDYETVEANQIKAHEEFEKSIRADVTKNNPKPNQNGSGSKSAVSKEAFDKMGYSDRVKLYKDDPELYKKLNKGE